jgi:hypothetical protein
VPRNKRVKKDSEKQAAEQVAAAGAEESATVSLEAQRADGRVSPSPPSDDSMRFSLQPEQFVESQNQLEEQKAEWRRRVVYADSVESAIGYNSLIRLLGHYYVRQVAYYRSAEGGNLPADQARARAYRECNDEEQAKELFELLMSKPVDWIDFQDLMQLNSFSSAMAQNVWEIVKREARDEFESGHLAAGVFEPVDYLKDAWARARYLGLRESFADEWEPRGGIELGMIDLMAQAFFQVQYWTEQSVLRARTEPREEAYEYQKWKHYNREAKTESWKYGNWDIPYVREQEAVEHAAAMADRWQRMYFRAVRQLRDWRRYTPQVTINNPRQVNIATDGGKQVNVNSEE